MTLFYEDFRDDPATFMTGLARDLGVEFEPQCEPDRGNRLTKTLVRPARSRIRHFWVIERSPVTWLLQALYGRIVDPAPRPRPKIAPVLQTASSKSA